MNMKMVAELSSKILFILFICVFIDECVYKGAIVKRLDDLQKYYKFKDKGMED